MSSAVKRIAAQYLKKYGTAGALAGLDAAKTESILESQGYDVVEFHVGYNSDDVAELISLLGLENYILTNRGFTYADENSRIVFVNGDLSDTEKMYVLLHEQGHILCGHMNSGNVIGRDVVQEYEANEFLHYVLNPPAQAYVYIHRKAAAAIVAGVIAVSAGAAAVLHHVDEQKYYGDYYVTETGHKYHRKDCIFIKNKNSVRRMTEEDFESGEYEPCEVCTPQ